MLLIFSKSGKIEDPGTDNRERGLDHSLSSREKQVNKQTKRVSQKRLAGLFCIAIWHSDKC